MLRGMLLGLGLIGIVAGGCSKVPPEPSPIGNASRDVSSTTPPAATTTASEEGGSLAGRCVTATPETAPPEVKAVSESQCPKDPDKVPALPVANLTIDADGKEVHLEAELARTPKECERGLMYRREMPQMHGMLFALGARKEQAFWMRNTCIPLDMLFVDQDGLIVGILENVPPMNEAERAVGCPSTHVLEMNAGWCRHHGVRAGHKLRLPR